MKKVRSADGTVIAYERSGSGPALVLVAGALTDRRALQPLAAALSEKLTVINFDRRGRGDSGDTAVDPMLEIADIASMIEVAGGKASIYGHSSGAGLAFNAAASGLQLEKLILHEPPYHPDDEDEAIGARKYSEDLTAVLADGRPGDAVELFLSIVSMPDEMIRGLKESPDWAYYENIGGSLAWDSAGMGDSTGGKVPFDRLAKVTAPTMLLEGSETFPFMIEVGKLMAAEMPNAGLKMLEGADHEARPEVVAPAIFQFLGV